MPSKNSNHTYKERWTAVYTLFSRELGQLSSWWDNPNDFREIRIKARDDGTVLAIAKGYDADGTPIVCFGVGYDVLMSLVAINATITGGNWRVDTPWEEKKSKAK